MRTRRRIIGILLVVPALVSSVLMAPPASAFPKGDPVYQFKYKVIATSHIAKAGLTLSPPPGIFKGGIDLANGQLLGSITLPDTTFTQSEAGIGLVTATAAIVPAKPVTGHVTLSNFKVTATSVFNIHILTMYLATPSLPTLPTALPPLPIGLPISLPPIGLPPVNLVGNNRTDHVADHRDHERHGAPHRSVDLQWFVHHAQLPELRPHDHSHQRGDTRPGQHVLGHGDAEQVATRAQLAATLYPPAGGAQWPSRLV